MHLGSGRKNPSEASAREIRAKALWVDPVQDTSEMKGGRPTLHAVRLLRLG